MFLCLLNPFLFAFQGSPGAPGAPGRDGKNGDKVTCEFADCFLSFYYSCYLQSNHNNNTIGCVVTHQGARGKDGEPGSAGPTVRISVFCFILLLNKT